ncbi:MAG: ribosome silencing factor [Rickettsiaceae bacterium]|nr:ribosome silencing factor [Rickettsiaceae bacterium]
MKSKQKIYSLQELNFLNKSKLKIGVLGGTFDPAHAGHLMISKRALSFYKFDYVVWLVANQNPLKQKSKKNIFARAEQALNIVDDSRILISTAEHDFGTKYMYDSMSCLIKHFPNVEFTWMMGIDNVINFRKWYRSSEIPKLCNIIIFDRPCSARGVNPADFGLKPTADLDNTAVKNIIIDTNELYDISSTQIRQKQKDLETKVNLSKEELKDFILKCLEEKKAENISCIKINNETPLAEYMLFASGRSAKNIQAIAEFTAIELKKELKWKADVEGLKGSDWVLLDAGDVIVHLFHPEARERLKLEELWDKKNTKPQLK